jgi:hypothetical protein
LDGIQHRQITLGGIMFIIKGFVSDGYDLWTTRIEEANSEVEAERIHEEMIRSGMYDIVNIEEEASENIR